MFATLTVSITNLVGAAVVFAFAAWAVPGPPLENGGRVLLVNGVAAAVFVAIAIPVGIVWGGRRTRRLRAWIIEERPPTEAEARDALHAPTRLFTVQLALWLVAAIGFTLVNGLISVDLIARTAFTIVLGALSTSAIAYLLAERALRPLAARALDEAPAERPQLPGVTARFVVTWALGTGVPLLGLVITAIFALAQGDSTATQLAVIMLTLGGTALVVGFYVAVLGSRAVADPVRSVREGLAEVEKGDLTVRIPVFDGSELGLLQTGFNRMAAGLLERETLRDLFGRQVGQDVARGALDRGAGLGGEVRDVAVLFVDMVGSTALAAERPPSEVVALLNRYFAVIVDVVDEHQGWVNKFQGDAALVVFGAPADLDDPAGRCLAAGRELARRLCLEVPERAAGVGIASGPVVAGNMGDERRFEYTVIGDAVNEAARLCELAKGEPSRVLASATTVEAATGDEHRHWCLDGSVTLRGRRAETRLARPVGPEPEPRTLA